MAEDRSREARGAAPGRGGKDGLYGLTPGLVRAVGGALADADGARVSALFAPLHDADTADLIERFRPDERRRLVALAHDVLSGDVLAHVEDGIREELIAEIGAERAAEAIADMDSDDAVAVLEDLDAPRRAAILEAIPGAERAGMAEGLAWPEDSAGRLMQRELVALPAFWTVGQTIDHMREARDLPSAFYEIYVIDPRHEPIGRVPLHKLLRTRRPLLLRDIMATDLKAIPAATDQEEVGHVFDRYDLVSAPVTGEGGRLIGVITVDDVVDVIQEEAGEDILRLSGVRAPDLPRAALRTARGRFTWLLVNLGTAILASYVIYQFDGTIDQMVALAILMPIVASMGGNAGTQTMTVAVRAIATKDLTLANLPRVLWKEAMVGGINGVVFAVLTGGAAAAWYGDVALGVVIGAAMIVNMLAAGLFGLAIPTALWRLGIDPATAAGVLLTTVTDVIGFLAFLGLAAAILL